MSIFLLLHTITATLFLSDWVWYSPVATLLPDNNDINDDNDDNDKDKDKDNDDDNDNDSDDDNDDENDNENDNNDDNDDNDDDDDDHTRYRSFRFDCPETRKVAFVCEPLNMICCALMWLNIYI